MSYKEFIGIDVSKLTIDVALYHAQKHLKFNNNRKGFMSMLKWVFKTAKSNNSGDFLFCLEHTGIYKLPFCSFGDELKLAYCLESPLRIKKSLGIARGKNDKIDASRIARYCYLHREELNTSQLPAKAILKLKHLLSLREKLVSHLSGFKACITEASEFLSTKDLKEYFSVQESLIKIYDKKLKEIDLAIRNTIDNDEELSSLNMYVQSVPGIGPVIAAYMIAFTNGFTAFETWRQFACYIGIAPFDHQSGTSLKGKTQISQLANKRIKTVVNSGARSAVNSCNEYKMYYKKRIDEGKNEHSIINVIRNKIVARAFACAKRKSIYVDISKYAA